MNNAQTKFNLFILGITIILMFSMISCDRPQSQHSTNDTINTNDVFRTDEKLFCSREGFYFYKTTIEIDRIKHEYITVNGYRRYAITHYPECKFCKQKKEKQND